MPTGFKTRRQALADRAAAILFLRGRRVWRDYFHLPVVLGRYRARADQNRHGPHRGPPSCKKLRSPSLSSSQGIARLKGSARGATAIERVGQPTVQPSLAAYAVVLAVDGFAEHVRVASYSNTGPPGSTWAINLKRIASGSVT